MKLAALTIIYNEEDFVVPVIENWKGIVEKHLFLHSEKPWHGNEMARDNSEDIIKRYGHTQFIRNSWKHEHDQRNYGIGLLSDYDYVVIVDTDEFYTKEDQRKIVDTIKGNKSDSVFRANSVRTYFKTLDYTLDPPDTHKPIIVVDPKKTSFFEHRCCVTEIQPVIDVVMHHLSYCRDRDRLRAKLDNFEHWASVKPFWIEEVYDKWHDGMEDVRAYGHEKSKAIRNPAPDELKHLIFG